MTEATEIREKAMAMAAELAESIKRAYAPQVERATQRGDMNKLADLGRSAQQDYHRALQPIVKLLAELPPEPIVIPRP